jgi:site-specific recombinase XerD
MSKKIPLEQLITAVTDELLQMNYKPSTILKYHRFFTQIIKLAQESDMQYFSNELAELYMLRQFGQSENRTGEIRQAMRAIKALSYFQQHECLAKRIILPTKAKYPEQFLKIQEYFGDYLRKRNLSLGTVNLHQKGLQAFYDYLISVKMLHLENISKDTIAGYIETLVIFQKETVRSRIYSLRSFLRYAAETGLHQQSLEAFIPKLLCPRGERLASTWTATETMQILSVVDRGSPTGKRDYAILLLAARLGIRSADITALKLGNIKWEHNCIDFVQSKTGKAIQLPLTSEVGTAIIDYLQHGRPHSTFQNVFIRHIAPFDPLMSIYQIVDKHVRLSGVDPCGRKHGAHSFRHSLVSRLLENSTPYPVVSEILGHSSANTTKSYTHLDIEQLRTCALDPEEVMLYA